MAKSVTTVWDRMIRLTTIWDRMIRQGVFAETVMQQVKDHLEALKNLPDDNDDKQDAIKEIEEYLKDLQEEMDEHN